MAVCNFPPVKYKRIFTRSSFLDDKSKHTANIDNHAFNCAVDVLLPGINPSLVPEDLKPGVILSHQHSYCVKQLPLKNLIDSDFIAAFVKKGKMTMLSQGMLIDRDNTVALLPNGTLILNINKDTYHELGLAGKISVYKKQKTSRYVVKVDLTEPSFQPGKKGYERVKWCFSDRLNLQFDFLVSWEPKDTKVCSSSIEYYFRSVCGLQCKEVPVKMRKTKLSNGAESDISQLRSDITENHSEVFEWLGAMACGIQCDGLPDDYVTTLGTPAPHEPRLTTQFTCRGYFPPTSIHRLVDKLRSESAQRQQWMALTVHGHQDAPVSWGEMEHGFHLSGEHLYTFVIFPNGDYWHYIATADLDTVS